MQVGNGAPFTDGPHAPADGIGALRMAEVYTDLKRKPPRPPEVDLDQIFAEAAEAEQGALLEAGADMSDSILDTATRTLGHNLRRQGGILTRAVGVVAGLLTDPAKLASGVTSAVDQIRSTLDTATGGRPINAGAPLRAHRSPRRHLEVLHLSPDDAAAPT